MKRDLLARKRVVICEKCSQEEQQSFLKHLPSEHDISLYRTNDDCEMFRVDKSGIMKQINSLLLIILSFILMLFIGCATPVTVSLKPTISETNVNRLPLTIGIYHSQDFCNFKFTTNIYGNEFIFPIGSACDDLLDHAYPMIFDNVVKVETFPFSLPAEKKFAVTPDLKTESFQDELVSFAYPKIVDHETILEPFPSLVQPERHLDVILAPKIEIFQLDARPLTGPSFAELVYQFTLYTPENVIIFSWKSKGWGESYNEPDASAKSAERAIQGATSKFIDGFTDIPELKRWTRGLSMDGATAVPEKQIIRLVQDAGEDVLEGCYENVVTVRGHSKIHSATPAKISQEALTEKGISAIQLKIINESAHRLIYQTSDITLSSIEGKEIEPVPGSIVAAMLTKRHSGLPPGPGGIGLAALPNLIISLINVALIESERKELEELLAAFKSEELQDKTLAMSESANGLLFFPMSDGKAIAGELHIPIVDTDEAVRFIIRLPIKQ